MKTVITIVVLSTMVFTLSAQVPVKKDLMQMFDKISAPPATVKEAFTRVTVNNDQGIFRCSAEDLFKSIEQEAQAVNDEFAAQPKPTVSSTVPGLSPENANKMNDPEMKKKMKAMSREERIKMAMELMKSAPSGQPPVVMDPPSIRAALDEWQKVYNDTQNEFQRSVSDQQEEIKLAEEYQKSHSEIDSWEAAEIAKLPQISSGEMSAPDPAKVKEVQLKSSTKHIATANRRLEQIRPRWRASVEHAKAIYKVFYQKLAAADYAADSKNFSTKKVLADAQIRILVTISSQIRQSRNAWEESASWQARRVNIENE